MLKHLKQSIEDGVQTSQMLGDFYAFLAENGMTLTLDRNGEVWLNQRSDIDSDLVLSAELMVSEDSDTLYGDEENDDDDF